MKSLLNRHLPRLMLCLACAAAGHASEAPQAQRQLERFADQLETLRAEFAQQVRREDGTLADRSSGRVWLRRPNRFRWEYGGDFPELLVAAGSHVWIYDELLEQVTVRDQSRVGADSPLILLTDLGQLNAQFQVREMGELDGLHLLALTSKDAEAEFERVLLGFADDTLRLMVLEDAFGLRTEIEFRRVERNPPLGTALFRFEPPESADVIGELPEAGES